MTKMNWAAAHGRDLVREAELARKGEGSESPPPKRKRRRNRPPKAVRIANKQVRAVKDNGYTIAGDVTVIHADGTRETKAAYSSASQILAATQPQSVMPGARTKVDPKTGLIRFPARKTSFCNCCGAKISAGDWMWWDPHRREGFCAGDTCRPNPVTLPSNRPRSH